MGLRELLILVLILAIVGVILRGLYVALRARRGQLRMRLDKNVPSYDPEELVLSELPNGGARMVERSFAKVVMQNSELSARDRLRYAKGGESAIPVLMDTVNEDDTEEEEQAPVAAPRQSSVASARDAARHKHLRGQSSLKPVHRPIDRMAAQAAASAVAPQSFAETAFAEPAFADSIADAEEPFDDVYADPVEQQHGFAAITEQDDDFLDESEDDKLDDDDDDYEDELPAVTLGSADPDDEYEDDEDHEDHEYEDDDEYDDDEYDEDSADEDDAAEEYDDDAEDDDIDESEEDEDDEDDAASASWQDEHYADDELLDYVPVAEEFDDVYGDKAAAAAQDSRGQERSRAASSYADDEDDEGADAWEEEPAEPAQAAVSAPRRWLKWAGDKLSGMGATAEEPVHERDFGREDRAEPVIKLAPDAEAPRQRKPAKRAERAPQAQPASKAQASLDRSRQTQMSFGHEEEEPVQVSQTETAAPIAPRAEPRSEPRAEPAAQQASALQEYSEVLVINVVAKPDREFTGVDLLPALLSAGLRFGEMSIFHKHTDNKASSPVLFSVANMLNPGTFDLNEVNDFATRGVCFFMTLPNVATSMQAFDRMLDAAQQLRIALDADLKDDARSVMTAQTIEHYRQRVRDFDLRQLRQHK